MQPVVYSNVWFGESDNAKMGPAEATHCSGCYININMFAQYLFV